MAQQFKRIGGFQFFPNGQKNVVLRNGLVAHADRHGVVQQDGSFLVTPETDLDGLVDTLRMDREMLQFVNPDLERIGRAGGRINVPLSGDDLDEAQQSLGFLIDGGLANPFEETSNGRNTSYGLQLLAGHTGAMTDGMSGATSNETGDGKVGGGDAEFNDAFWDALTPPNRENPFWVNPTDGGLRDDNRGQGAYRTPRGERSHAGVDYAGAANALVRAPREGNLEVIRSETNPFNDGARITTGRDVNNTRHAVRILHIYPDADMDGQRVKAGQTIGRVRPTPYQDMDPHAHVEIYEIEEVEGGFEFNRVDPSTLIDFPPDDDNPPAGGDVTADAKPGR